MLHITTDKTVKHIDDVDSHFRVLNIRGDKFNSDEYTDIMKRIDNIKKRDGIVIETIFGTTTINDLSSGCKAVILALYYAKEKIHVSIDCCGENALKVLFEYAEKYDLYAYAEQSIFINVVDITCEIDGEQFNGGYDIFNRTAKLR